MENNEYGKVLNVKYEFKRDKPFHTLFLITPIILLILILIVYPTIINNEKLKGHPEKISICLLGSYIILNSVFNYIHCAYHRNQKMKFI